MTARTAEASSPIATLDAFSAAELSALCARIVASGVLGRSKHYAALLQYLVTCAIEGRSPKEIEIAVEALGRDEDFDVGADSAVRVYVHQLRKKLSNYYESYEREAKFQIHIPKGAYALAALRVQSPAFLAVAKAGTPAKLSLTNGLLLALVVLLAVNLIYLLGGDTYSRTSQFAGVVEHPVWGKVLDDDRPILLVMGDYYIFGELNSNGNVARMVREFNVNSRGDLEDLQFSDMEQAENYLDLDLSYMPEGSALALAKVVPILQESGKNVNITMMSDLTTGDIRSNHIVYIGYLSALDKLANLAFAGSGLRPGRSFDELFNTKTAEYYTSDAGLPEEGEPFHDYGMFSTFPASSQTQVILIAGMRDAGLMHTAQALSDSESLDDLVSAMGSNSDEALASFEVLFEVFGVDRLNFDANLVYANQLDANQIWGPGRAEPN